MADRPRLADARALVAALQAAVDARDAEQLRLLFDDGAVLVGSGADAREPDALRAYLEAVVAEEPFRWELDEYVVFHEEGGELGFAAFGEIVQGGRRAPFRLTIFAVETYGGWRLRHFHGSLPSDF